MELKKLMGHISIIPDYRQAWKMEHKLSDILLLTICAVISGAEGWEDIEDFGETPIARVVSCISPAKFHECFINWMRDCHSSNDKDVIAIDGKALPHSYDKSGRRRAGFRSLPRLSPALNTTPTHRNLNSSASCHAGNFSLYSRNAIIDSSASMRVA